jgi:hypothetical protein
MKTLGGALLEKFLPYGTYLALILAFMFNIGYFAPIDIRLFTLFSLSEHLLFSIEAIPIAFLVFILGPILTPSETNPFDIK